MTWVNVRQEPLFTISGQIVASSSYAEFTVLYGIRTYCVLHYVPAHSLVILTMLMRGDVGLVLG